MELNFSFSAICRTSSHESTNLSYSLSSLPILYQLCTIVHLLINITSGKHHDSTCLQIRDSVHADILNPNCDRVQAKLSGFVVSFRRSTPALRSDNECQILEWLS